MKLRYSYVTTSKAIVNRESGFESHTQQILPQNSHSASTGMATKHTDNSTDVNFITLNIFC
jgi:hypothetical protein